jgi:hypothetical protein
MASAIARRRAAKAARRKKVLKERHGAAPVMAKQPLAQEVRKWADAPLHACLLQNGLFDRGNGLLILARKTASGGLATTVFLLDAFCLGVKDIVFRRFSASEFDDFLAVMGDEESFVPVELPYARRLIRDLVAYGRSIGIEPAADYAAIEHFFGDVSSDDCEVPFRFGYEGKPLYIPGPTETKTQIRRRMDQLRRRVGEDGFDFIVAADADEDDLFDDNSDDPYIDDLAGYDPEEAPDPAEWLERDKDERLLLVEAYHARAGVDLPNANLHAAFHVIVENQIALGDELPVGRTVERLMAEGLSRHEAVHAVGSVLTALVYNAAKGQDRPKDEFNDDYNAAVERLTAEGWRRSFEEEED